MRHASVMRIRISAKYGNLDLLEDGYGINLVPARFAMKWYDKDSWTVLSWITGKMNMMCDIFR